MVHVTSDGKQSLLQEYDATAGHSLECYGWENQLYLVYMDSSGARRLRQADPLTGKETILSDESVWACFFSGDEFYYLPYGDGQPNVSAPQFKHLSLSDPTQCNIIGAFPGYGPIYQHHGVFYCSGFFTDALWALTPDGTTRFISQSGLQSSVNFYDDQALDPHDSASVVSGDSVTLYNVNTGSSRQYSLLFQYPFRTVEAPAAVGETEWYSDGVDFAASEDAVHFEISHVYQSADGLVMEVHFENVQNTPVWVSCFALECVYDGQPFSFAFYAGNVDPGESNSRYVVFPALRKQSFDLDKLSWTLSAIWQG